MFEPHGSFRRLWRRVVNFFIPRPVTAGTITRDCVRAAKELAYWSASDAGLSGPIEVFDGAVLLRAADGLLTVRMTLKDSLQQRTASDAATIVMRTFEGVRAMLLIDIDGRRFTSTPPFANLGVREYCESFANRRETASSD